MRYLSFLFLLFLLINIEVSAQSCLPQGIVFNAQSAIDSFPINYPGCTEIEGDVKISGFGITNLNGLSTITIIGGTLRILNNLDLLSLSGLTSLTSIGESLMISGNRLLTNLSGLDNLSFIGVNLILFTNGFTSFNGLSSITFINNAFFIVDHDSLTNLIGLESIISIGSDFVIQGNDNLTSLTGLDSVTFIDNFLIDFNPSLISLSGLEAVIDIPGGLNIWNNNALKNITGLHGLTNLGGASFINNSSLASLSGLENITSLTSGLDIYNNDSLVNLNGLDSITSIGGLVSILDNNSLINLSGLDNVTSIGGYLTIKNNDVLTSLTGLNNVTSIGGYLTIWDNNTLTSLSGLIKLTSIGDYLAILDNDILTSLYGLDNIYSYSIEDVHIQNNDSLSFCAVKSICDYLASSTIYGAYISNNECGCNSRAEVEAACATYAKELNVKVFLQGAYADSNIMNTNLTSILPNAQPYDYPPWMYPGVEQLDSIPPDMVDWVLVELRDSSDYNIVYETKTGVLLSNGSIKGTNLLNGIQFYNIDTGYYYVVVRHRNHISVMTEQPIFLSSLTQVDFTDTTSLIPFGDASQAQIELVPGVWGMICGDVNQDGKLKYSGPDNDRMMIIQLITNVSGSTSITSVINGYYFEDLNLNTEVKYSGPNNDGAIIIQNIVSLTGSTNISNVYICPVMFLYP